MVWIPLVIRRTVFSGSTRRQGTGAISKPSQMRSIESDRGHRTRLRLVFPKDQSAREKLYADGGYARLMECHAELES